MTIDNKQAIAQELGQSIHDILAKHLKGQAVDSRDVLNIVVSALAPSLGDLISFIPEPEQRLVAVKLIKERFGINLAVAIEEYLMR